MLFHLNFFFEICLIDNAKLVVSKFWYFYICTNYLIFFCLVCITLMLRRLCFKQIGALTSKPFSFKARAWELNSTFIVDITNFLGEWLRVDLKSLEIVRILPWLDTNVSETWISDKSWFFYDGLSLNKIIRFYLWKKLFFIPLFFFFVHLNDNLFRKYISIWPSAFSFWKLSTFSSDKENFFEFYFNFYFFFNQYTQMYSSLWTFCSCAYHFNSKESLWDFNFKAWTNRKYLFLRLRKKKRKFFLYWIINRFLLFRKVWLWKKVSITMWKWKNYSSISNSSFMKFIFFNLLVSFKNLQFNFFTDSLADSLILSFIKNISLNKKINKLNTFSGIKNFWTFNVFFPVKLQNFFFGQNVFSILTSFKWINKFNLILLIGANLRLLNPKLHIQFWKAVRLCDLLVISILNFDSLLFWNLNFGSDISVLKKIFFASNWLVSFFIKKHVIGFVFNFDYLTKLNSLFIFLPKFLAKNLLSRISLLSVWNRTYFFSKFYFFYFSKTAMSNFLVNFKIKNSYILKKRTLPMNSFHTTKLFVSVGLEKNWETFLLNFFSRDFFFLKRYFFCLLESNIVWVKIANYWDLVFPLTTLTENFFLFRNFKQIYSKSLFIKFGAWFSWTFFNFLRLFKTLYLFPFFWVFNMKKNFSDVKSLFFDIWLNLPPKVCTIFIWKILNLNAFNIFNVSRLLTYLNFVFVKVNIKSRIFIFSKNYWYSELSFLKTSKYTSFGYNLVDFEKKTFI